LGKQHGYEFEKEIGKSLELLKEQPFFRNLWYYKLVDTYAYDWIKDYIDEPPKQLDVHRTAQSKYQMVLPKVPCDFLALLEGVCIFIECKSSKDEMGFPIGNIKDHQLAMAADIVKADSPFYFFICKREPRNNILYIVEASKIIEMINVAKTGKIIKSKLAWSLLADTAMRTIPKGKGRVYDLSEPLKTILNDSKQ